MNFKISDSSIKTFATLICKDIYSYIQENKEEYNTYLNEVSINNVNS